MVYLLAFIIFAGCVAICGRAIKERAWERDTEDETWWRRW